MVAGDLVNTASRVQSAAEPGTVLVGDSTRRASDAAIAYEDAGTHELKGKSRARAALARAARDRRPRRRGALRRARAAVRRPRPRAPPRQGAAPRRRRGAEKAHLLSVVGIAGHRQVAARLGVREVRRRPRPERLVAQGPLPRLRRGRRVLGARRDGAHAGAASLEEEAAETALAKLRRSSRSSSPTRRSARSSSRGSQQLLGLSDRTRRRPRGPLLRLAAVLRAHGRAGPRRPGLRGHPVGGRRRSSSSSSTCSSGRGTFRSS